jgi:pimeloyl-ACP methyl ester carboxylesterase
MIGSKCFKKICALGAVAIFFGSIFICSAAAAERSAPEVPAGKTVYDAPDPLPPGKHGDLIWAAEIKTGVPGARAWKVLYRSTDIHDAAMPVSGMVIAPKGGALAAGRPVVTYAHGTTGMNRDCGISRVDDPAKDATFYFLPNSPDTMDCGIPGLTEMIAAGYVVAATDYQGLGAPGFHQYLVGPTAARNVLDIAVAAQQIPQADAGKRVVALGWSQGGQASIWAAQLADYAAGSAEILGAAAIAPVNALEQGKIEDEMRAQGKKLPMMMTAETTMAQYALSETFPELKLSDVLTPFGIEFIREASRIQGSKHLGQALNYMEAWKGPATRPDPQNQEAWLKRLEQLALGYIPAKVPIAVYQGDDDTIIFPAATEAYVKKARAAGTAVSYKRYANTDHLRAVIESKDDFLGWIADRFAGKPAPSNDK